MREALKGGRALEGMSPEEKAREFFSIFVFKVEPCPQKNKHPWDSCDYCHPQENARRRDVRKYRYIAEACPDYKMHGYCALGNECPFAHGVFEINLHPAKYRTQMCTEGYKCSRKVCFFAHNDAQLRQPDYRYGYRSAGEAELVKEKLLSEAHSQVVNVRTGGASVPPLHRISPVQAAPGTPPQCSPPRLFAAERAVSVADSFRGLPAALNPPASALGQSNLTHSLPLYDLKNAKGWTSLGDLDASAAGSRLSLSEMLPHSTSADIAAAQYLHKASQHRSMPADTGPRISMKVRRELGLEPPAKHRGHSMPVSGSGGGGGFKSLQNNLAVRSFLSSGGLGGLPASQLPVTSTLPPLHSSKATSPGAFAPPLQSLAVPMPDYKSLRVSVPAVPRAASLRVVAPGGAVMEIDEAMASLGITAPGSSRELSFVASVLDVLSRLGYTLAPDSVSSRSQQSEATERERLSGQSTPDASALSSFATQLDLGHGAEGLLSSGASAPGLAGFGLSSGTSNSYALWGTG